MSFLLRDLNDQQSQAAQIIDGPVMVLAGAGTGKTRTLTYRLAYMIHERGIAPESIVALTFTRKAASEMKDRIGKLIGDNNLVSRLFVGTFHAFCLHLLSQELSIEDRFPEGFVILDNVDQEVILRRILSEVEIEEDAEPITIKKLRRLISHIKNLIIYAKEDEDKPPIRIGPYLKRLFNAYQRELNRLGAFDFDDLLGATYKILESAPTQLKSLRSKFVYFLVDEFQDVNELQYRLLQILSTPLANVFVIGDVDQAIYSFRGASTKIFLRFKQDFNDTREIHLETSYRSTEKIIQLAQTLIKHNKERLPYNIVSDHRGGSPIQLHEFYSDKEEANFIVSTIEKFIGGSCHYKIYQEKGETFVQGHHYKLSDFAILFRTHHAKRCVEEELEKSGLPVQSIGGKVFWEEKAVREIIAYLITVLSRGTDNHILEIINVPPRKIGKKTLDKLLEISSQKETPLFNLIKEVESLNFLNKEQKEQLSIFYKKVKNFISILPDTSPHNLIKKIWEDMGLSELYEKKAKQREAYLSFVRYASQFAHMPHSDALKALLDEITVLRPEDIYDPKAEKVLVSTIHAAKGLEFPVVFICGLEEGLLPLVEPPYSQGELEEERRLFYVAITRAKNHLYITWARRRNIYGAIKKCTPSSFLKELDPDVMMIHTITPEERPEKKKRKKKESQLELW